MLKRATSLRWLVMGLCLTLGLAWQLTQANMPVAFAQSASDGELESTESTESADEGDEAEATNAKGDKTINLLKLLWDGGVLMLPIVAMSLIVVTFAIERGMALRRSRLLPEPLVSGLSNLSRSPGGFDPRKAYRLCQQHPSAAGAVIRAMLLKVGRPHSEVEHAVSEASDREAGRLFANVRWITLAAAVSPLLGLFGTVWGMIVAFNEVRFMAPGSNPAEKLADGIFIALVSTLGGLAVAIPAAIVAHFFEGRIQSIFHQIDELLFNLLPQIERFEGRLRVNHQSLDETAEAPIAPAQPATATPK